MHFDARDIRKGMDVFTADNVHLGSVVLLPEPARRHPQSPVDAPSSLTSGESLGPAPTSAFGNRGPFTQAAQSGYATAPDDGLVFSSGSFVVGKWFGLLGRKRISMDFVQAVSAERIVLRRSDSEVS